MENKNLERYQALKDRIDSLRTERAVWEERRQQQQRRREVLEQELKELGFGAATLKESRDLLQKALSTEIDEVEAALAALETQVNQLRGKNGNQEA